MHWIVDTVRHYLIAWGYWGVVLGLVGEDAGLPLPGETLLIFASFLAYNHHQLSLPWIIVVGTAAATLGDNIGYWIGRKGGRKLLDRWKHLMHVTEDDIRSGEDLMRRRGSLTVFFARFIWGLRMLAGPLAGILRMDWRRFALFNALGAGLWVGVIAGVGYLFGSKFDTLLSFFKKADIAIMAGVAGLGIFLWIRYKKRQKRKRQQQQKEPSQARRAS